MQRGGKETLWLKQACWRERAESEPPQIGRGAPVRTLMDAILDDRGRTRAGWTLEGVTSGYYYYNERYRRGRIEVTLEGSSYVARRDAVGSGVLQKLVFHSTRELCGDWVPNSQVIGCYD
jgi:hypothetical protein